MIHARPPSSLLALVALVVLLLPSLAAAQHVPVGKDFQVNSYTGGRQNEPALATDADGDFVVVWRSYQDGESAGIFAQRFSSAGAVLGDELQVNSYTSGLQVTASVAMDADGAFVVAWVSQGQDGHYDGIFASRFSSAGTLLATEFQVSSYTVNGQGYPSVATDADGDFAIFWESFAAQDGWGAGIFGQRFSSTGAALGGEFQVNTFTTGNQRSVSASADADGDFVVAWRSRDQDGQGYGVFGRRFSSSGDPQAAEFQVNSHTAADQYDPSVAHDAAGNFAIAWTDGPYPYDVFARTFASDGTALGSDFQVHAYTTGYQGGPSVAATSDGFVVAWSSGGEVSLQDVFARPVSSAGVALATEFQVNTHTGDSHRQPAIARGAGGDFVVVWGSDVQDGSDYGIFGQRFAAGIALDSDGDGTVQPLTDGLLFLRFAFLFSGSALVDGAVDEDCYRCDSSTIAPYLSGLGLALDIDGNDAVGALDGLLVLRYLFGLRGAKLTEGVGGDCTRCEPPAIEQYLDSLSSLAAAATG